MMASRKKRPTRRLAFVLAVVLGWVAAAIVGLGACAGLRAPEPRSFEDVSGALNVLLVTIDTLRADRLGAYGHAPARTPVMDALAASGARFDNAYSPVPLTLPAHATLMTGTHPAHHGIADNGRFILPEEASTLAESLTDAGVETGAVIAAFVLHRQFGLDQGFDAYDDRLSAGRRAKATGYDEMSATHVSDRALAWLGERSDERWFLWLHYFDPHAFYEPPPPFDNLRDPYDGEIAYVDAELGRVLAELDRRGLRERTLVIVTADHGESLDEHGESTHGLFLYDAVMRVPLVASLPGVIAARTEIANPVALADVAPTVLVAAGVPVPDSMQGRSLAPLLFSDDATWDERPVLLETEAPWRRYGWASSRAIVSDGFKLIQAPRPELYDLGRDAGELTNVIDDHRPRARAMADALADLRARYGQSSLAALAGTEMDDATRDRLTSLGYVFASGSARERSVDAADVKDRVDILRDINRAGAMRAAGKEDEATALLESVLERSPETHHARNQLGTWYARRRDFENAERHFKRVLELDADNIEVYENLGQLYVDTARLDRAAVLAKTALARFPRSAKAHGLMGLISTRKREYDTALEHFERALEYYPNFHQAFVNRSVAHYMLGDKERALEDLRTALRIVPDNRNYAQFVDQLERELSHEP